MFAVSVGALFLNARDSIKRKHKAQRIKLESPQGSIDGEW
jgi:hypothetical protein